MAKRTSSWGLNEVGCPAGARRQLSYKWWAVSMSLLVALACSGERPKFGQRRAAALGADGGTAGETTSSTSFSGDGVPGASAGSTRGITGSGQPGNSPAGDSS